MPRIPPAPPFPLSASQFTGLLFTGLVLALLLPLQAVASPSSASAPALPQGLIALDGENAPALHLSDMDGKTIDIRDLRGSWVFVHFWASWCGPCRRELPALAHMVSLLREADDTAMSVILVNTAEDEDTIFGFLGAVAPGLHTYMDRDGLLTERWQPRGLPATYLVDPQGRLRYQALGGLPWDTTPYLGFLRRLTPAGALHTP